MRKILLLLPVLASAVLATELMSEQDINKSKTITANMKKGLGGMLKQKLESEGKSEAFAFCSEVAMSATKKISDENNVTVRRVSEKLRNPLNAPDALDTKALKEYAKYKNETEAPKHLALKDEKSGAMRFYEPMYTVGMCLTCHGKPVNMSAGVKDLIEKKYPSDKAIGYEAEEFRGLIVIEKR
jgi:cytochrome c553